MSVAARTLRPSFSGIMRGEALKLSRQLSFWLSLGAAMLLLAVIVLAISGGVNIKNLLLSDPTGWAFDKLETFGTIFQIGSGLFLLVFGSRLLSMEYSAGTVRIIYARGTGRLQLWLAKVLTLAVVGIALLAGYMVLAGGILAAMIAVLAGSFDPINHLSSQFWHDLELWVLVMLISMGVAILIAAAAAGVGRSLAFGIAAALAFYPGDNFLNILEVLGIRATGHNQPWTWISQYQLSTNVNVLLNLLEPDHRARPAFAAPIAAVSAQHSLAVIGAFALILLVVALYRTLRPDVLE